MRLVHAPDGSVDRYDRALWLTIPFDLAFAAPAVTAPTIIRRAPASTSTHMRRSAASDDERLRRSAATTSNVIRRVD